MTAETTPNHSVGESQSLTARVRHQLPVLQSYTYLNSGTAGPLPLQAAEAIKAAVDHELAEGRGNFAAFGRYNDLLRDCRALCARVLGADADEVALTHHTSEAVGIVLTAFDWKPGDRIVTTTLEHDAICVPLGLLRQRYGVETEFVDIGLGELALERLEDAIKGARLVALSHVAFSSGATLPLSEIAACCRPADVPLLVDGAQSCGTRPIDVHALGIDFYTLSGQKWLCGPEGTGALYVRRDWIERLQPACGSYATTARHDFRANLQLHDSARRFETAIVNAPSWAGFAASVQWILDEVGLERIWAQVTALTQQARERLTRLPQVELLTPAACPSQLLTFRISGMQPLQMDQAALQLAQHERLVIRSIPTAPRALRASFGFFNDEQDVDRLAEAIAGICR